VYKNIHEFEQIKKMGEMWNGKLCPQNEWKDSKSNSHHGVGIIPRNATIEGNTILKYLSIRGLYRE